MIKKPKRSPFLTYAIDAAYSNFLYSDTYLYPSPQDYELAREYFPDEEDGSFSLTYLHALEILRSEGKIPSKG